MHTAQLSAAPSIPMTGTSTRLPRTFTARTTALLRAAQPLRPLMMSREWMFPAQKVTMAPQHRMTSTHDPDRNSGPRMSMRQGEKIAMSRWIGVAKSTSQIVAVE